MNFTEIKEIHSTGCVIRCFTCHAELTDDGICPTGCQLENVKASHAENLKIIEGLAELEVVDETILEAARVLGAMLNGIKEG